MIKRQIVILIGLIWIWSGPAFCQVSLRIELTELDTGEPIIGASIVDLNTGHGAVSNAFGLCRLSPGIGGKTFVVSHVGYIRDTLELNLVKDTLLKIKMRSLSIEEIIIVQEIPLHQQTLLGKISLSAKKIEQIPSAFGEPDLIKALTTLPGVTGDNRGLSSIFVRGGGRQNNLVLLDGSPVFLSNHAWGFLSQFNMDVIKSIDFYKGGFPARFGGRTASVIDLASKDGNKQEFKGKFSVGLLQSKVLFEGPIVKGKTSFHFGLRTSYLDWLTIPLRINYNLRSKSGQFVGYTFYDTNLKINHQFNPRNKLTFSVFHANDIQKLIEKTSKSDWASDFKYQQKNTLVSLRFQSLLSDKVSLNSSIVGSSYSNSFITEIEEQHQDYEIESMEWTSSSISDLTANTEITYQPNNKHLIRLGAIAKSIRNQPRTASYSFGDGNVLSDTTLGHSKTATPRDYCLYVEDEWKLTDRINANIGLHYNLFKLNASTFTNIDPRLSVRWLLTKNLSIKAGLTSMYQNLHVLTNNMGGIYSDLWLSSNSELPPERSRQLSGGVFGYIPGLGLEYGVELYYKKSENILELFFNDPEDLIGQDIENMILKNGSGIAYGLETQIKKEWDNFSASLSYTLSKNLHSFKEINEGVFFPSLFDRTHDLSMTFHYLIDEKQSIGGQFVFSTGTPITLPIGLFSGNYFFDDYYVFEGYNMHRLPVYHRLDLAYKRKFVNKKGRNCYWGVNIHNVYARKNPIHIYIYGGKVYKTTLFPFLPSASVGMYF